MVTVRCHAKINTVLLVERRRPDGFHDLDTEFVTLELHDLLRVLPADDGFSLVVAGQPSDVPVEDNLVMRAARLLRDALGEGALPGGRFELTNQPPDFPQMPPHTGGVRIELPQPEKRPCAMTSRFE